ncbi:MAG: 50S ribosomal protein L3 N(5)-glutamine methyltransferase [Magnetococcales bacterium]|nr:50S ribosomal protein L3 N(5)-glutamine methyltransferase [Magnetococcales bacterium]
MNHSAPDSDKKSTPPGHMEGGVCYRPVQPQPKPRSVNDWIRFVARQMAGAELCYATGMQEPYPESEYLVLHAFGLPMDLPASQRPAPPVDAWKRIEALLVARIGHRQPAAYITGEAFFAGHRFVVDERVLIPRSRIENILDDPRGFTPWLPASRVRRILDLGTGSGCLAIALALAYPKARVDAVDLSAEALKVAAINRERFGLQRRLRLIRSDLFAALGKERYDLIVTNPPYVPSADYARLPVEYFREPAMALSAGADGLDLLVPILRQAPDHLQAGGLLVCETGDDVQEILMARWPDLPVEWLWFHFGTSGVFAVVGETLAVWREHFI